MGLVIAIATSGYVVLSIYKIYYKTQFNEKNTYETLFTCLIFGLIPFSLYSIFSTIPFPPDILTNKFPSLQFLNNDSFHNLYKVLNISISIIIASSLVIWIDIKKYLEAIKEKLLEGNTRGMDLNMMSERDFDELKNSYDKVFIQLKDEKVIVGFVLFADFSDIVPPDLRILKIHVMKSGERNEKDSSKIFFNSNYEDLAFEQFILWAQDEYGNDYEKNVKFMKVQAQKKEEFLNDYAPVYSIFQREIRYYSPYNQDINDVFQKMQSFHKS